MHWNWGSLLLGLGVLIAIEGPVNTYLRTGAVLQPLLSAACAPVLQNARHAHGPLQVQSQFFCTS